MYFHVYLIYRFTRTFTDHSSVITRCWGFELQNGKSSLKSPQTLATQDFAPASFLSTPDTSEQALYRLLRLFFKKSERTHSAAPPFQAANAPLVCGLMRWGFGLVHLFRQHSSKKHRKPKLSMLFLLQKLCACEKVYADTHDNNKIYERDDGSNKQVSA